MTKQEAGRLGGLATVAKLGKDHMQTIGRRGAQTTNTRYRLEPVGQSGWALVRRYTGKVVRVFGNPWLDARGHR